jgi:hypothetical protein
MLVLMRTRSRWTVVLIWLLPTVLPSLALASVRKPLSTFVVVNTNMRLSLYSSITGARLRTLASFSPSFTSNGLAYAPDGSAVYFTLIPSHRNRALSLRLMRIDVTSGRRTFVADGEQPALSNNGKQLAYGAAAQGLAIRNLGTGQTRTIALKQLGRAADLSNASIHWLGDDSTVAIVPSTTPWDLVGKPPRLSWCGTSQRNPVIVFVRVPAPPAPLTATCVRVKGGQLDSFAVLGEDPTSPTTLLAATPGHDGGTIVERVTEGGNVTPMLTIPDSLAMSFDTSGTHLLYLAGHTPPLLTEATIDNGKLVPVSWRDRLDLGSLAW